MRTKAIHKPKPKKQVGGKNDRTRKIADRWGVTTQTVRNWIRENAPVDDDAQQATWIQSQQRVDPKVRAKAEEILAGKLGFDAFTEDPDWKDFEKALKTQTAATVVDNILEKFRGFYAFKLERATKAGKRREGDARFLTEQLIRLDRAIRENKLLSDKLGIEQGTTVQRADVQRWLRALGFWLMRGVDITLAEVVPKMTGLSPTITHEIARKCIEPSLIGNRITAPFVLATKISGGSQLPEWMVATIRDTLDDFTKNGAAFFDKEINSAKVSKK